MSRRVTIRWLVILGVLLITIYSMVTSILNSQMTWTQVGGFWSFDRHINKIALTKEFMTNLKESHINNRRVKTILYWNSFFGMKHFYFGIGKTPFIGCEETNCLVWDKEDGEPPLPVQQFDALMFHALDEPAGVLFNNIPPTRSEHQRYIFYLYESPGRMKFDFTPLANFFNLTITYRRDSDIYSPYNWIGNASAPSKTPINWIEPNYDNISIELKPSKIKPIAWFVSDCKSQSQRASYVTKLSRYIQVDVYGACGTLTCKRSRKHECLQMLEDNYMFYLSFENSLCEDYVTEKLFGYMMYNIVPIVYGGADYKTIAPPKSYINVKDYSSPEQLANYLMFLMKNPQEYQKYFWWKSYYQIGSTSNYAMCTLCAMLNDAELPNKVYTDIDTWWNNRSLCHTPSQHFEN